ncbi:MAG: C40 family peptidase [Chlorobiaceae bacterium]|nr:C40 family peptidase [Chlorobiaceae bacterium]
MESKYSLKKRKSYISCTRPEGLSGCPLPVHVTENSFRRMLNWIEAAKGTKYRFGGTVPDGFDCSGFVQYLYSISFQVQLPRTSADLALLGPIVQRSELQRGDLVFFSSGGEAVDHVGVFLGEERFAHSASKAGVIVSSLRQAWYDTHFCFGTRVVRVD